MKAASFEYHRAHDPAEAVDLLVGLGESGGDPKPIAGGQSLVPMMNFRLARPTALVDLAPLRRLPEMGGIRNESGCLRIGALTTHRQVEMSSQLGPSFAIVGRAMRWVGHLPIRTRGTVGGSFAHADATAEWCLLALLLDALVVAQGPRGRREIAADEMFHGFFTTALRPDEIVVEVRFRRGAPHASLTEFARRHGDFAIVNVAVSLDRRPDGSLAGGRVVVGGVAPVPVLVEGTDQVLRDTAPTPQTLDTLAQAVDAAIDPPADAAGSSAYRRQLTRTLVQRACRQALEVS